MNLNHKIAPITGRSRGLGKNYETDVTKPAFDARPQLKEMIASQTALVSSRSEILATDFFKISNQT